MKCFNCGDPAATEALKLGDEAVCVECYDKAVSMDGTNEPDEDYNDD